MNFYTSLVKLCFRKNRVKGSFISLKDKTVLIVGAGRGIGRATAELFANAGANLVICSRNFAELMELEHKINAKGNSKALAIEADATIESDVDVVIFRRH